MNGYLYKSYCYETIEQASNAVYSSFELPFGIIQSVTPNGSDLAISYIFQNGSVLSSSTFNYSLATCTKLGFDNSYSGLTRDDAVSISSAIVAVLIAAWVIKIVRRAL